jgi:hypothetical protein
MWQFAFFLRKMQKQIKMSDVSFYCNLLKAHVLDLLRDLSCKNLVLTTTITTICINLDPQVLMNHFLSSSISSLNTYTKESMSEVINDLFKKYTKGILQNEVTSTFNSLNDEEFNIIKQYFLQFKIICNKTLELMKLSPVEGVHPMPH